MQEFTRTYKPTHAKADGFHRFDVVLNEQERLEVVCIDITDADESVVGLY